ncbi:hypothetical protein MP228_003918 [Amoeboaphelidium protococcarum]|nr:hypothetical protein MP228_003918 [Amoeboaphelidium protococcarum]
MSIFYDLSACIKELSPLVTVGGTFVFAAAAGLIPCVGPGRAAWIALRSRFAFKPVPESIRKAEIEYLRSRLVKKDFDERYLVVTGEKGVGKSCLLRTAISKLPGVITLQAQPNHTQDDIFNNTLKELTRIQLDVFRPMGSAKRVIFWHRLFTFGSPPIVVINATEREPGDRYAGLTGAVRTLADEFKLRVIVDGSPNSLSDSFLRTGRQRVCVVKPMSWDMALQLKQFEALFRHITEAGMEDTVFAVLGGVPSNYAMLWDSVETALQNGLNARQVIGDQLCAQILAAIEIVEDSQTTGNDMKEILMLFDKKKQLIINNTLKVKELERSTPDRVLRKVELDGAQVLVPASNAISLVLQHNITKKPNLDQLQELIARNV